MLYTEREITLIVDEAVLLMATAKQKTFWSSFAEILFRLTKGYPSYVCEHLIYESHTRLEEFKKAWQTNLYNRRVLK